MDKRRAHSRRRFLATTGAASVAALAGCAGIMGDGGEAGKPTLADFRGSGAIVEDRPAPGGTSIETLPDLAGDLNVYLGGGEGGRYRNLIDLLERYYADFTVSVKDGSSSQLAKTIEQEFQNDVLQGDVFWSVDAGSLGYVSDVGATADLSDDVVSPVPEAYHPTNQWVGVAGRARSIPYNTNQFSASEMPTSIDAYTSSEQFQGVMGWAPTYGAFQSFVTAMRVLRGAQATKDWLNGMLDQNVGRYGNEFLVSQAVAEGELGAGFANHYYAVLQLADDPDAPIDLAFTKNDAGALVNVSGAAVLQGAARPELAQNFVRHLLCAEAQEFFATRGFAYPMISDVAPVGPLPSIDELNPPELDLTELGDVQATLELMREVGILG